MDDDILDDVVKVKSNFYYQASQKNLNRVIILIVANVFTFCLGFAMQWTYLLWISFFLFFMVGITTVIGLINGIKSYLEKEEEQRANAITLLTNSVVLVLFVGLALLLFFVFYGI